MSERLAHAPARESAAREWLAGYDPGDGHGPVGEEGAWRPDGMFTHAVVLDAFYAGANCADDEFAIERATGQRQLDHASALMAEAAALFMGYAQHHWARADEHTNDPAAQVAALHKARVNLLAALRLKEWMAGLDSYSTPAPGEDTAVAHAIDLPGVTTREQAQRLAEHTRVAVALVSNDGTFRLQTADPRFDPAQPVLINGYRYTPATEQ